MPEVWMKAFSIIAVCALTGCAVSRIGVSTDEYANMSPQELRSVDLVTLCSAYANFNRSDEEIIAELHRRDVEIVKDASVRGGYRVIGHRINEREWAAIEAREVYVGMSEPALVCSWGLPGSCGDLNTTQFMDRTVKQYVYKNCSGHGLRIAYVKNGEVVGLQY